MTDIKGAVLQAAKSGYADDIEALIQNAHADLSERDALGNTPLHYACASGHAKVVDLLIKSGKVDVNATNNLNETPLHRALGRAISPLVLQIVKLLVSANADLSIKNNKGERAEALAKSSEVKALVTPQASDWFAETMESSEEEEEEDDE